MSVHTLRITKTQARNSSASGIFTDGSCVPNPGHMGLGIVVFSDEWWVLSGYLGIGTNQFSELLALRLSLEYANRGEVILSDSKYAINVSLSRWRAHTYQFLIHDIRLTLEEKRVGLKWVKGHNGHPLQEMADRVAYKAAKTRRPGIEPLADLSVRAWAARAKAGLVRDPLVCDGARMDDQGVPFGVSFGIKGNHGKFGVARDESVLGSPCLDGRSLDQTRAVKTSFSISMRGIKEE